MIEYLQQLDIFHRIRAKNNLRQGMTPFFFFISHGPIDFMPEFQALNTKITKYENPILTFNQSILGQIGLDILQIAEQRLSNISFPDIVSGWVLPRIRPLFGPISQDDGKLASGQVKSLCGLSFLQVNKLYILLIWYARSKTT